jgi:hypothetical protein
MKHFLTLTLTAFPRMAGQAAEGVRINFKLPGAKSSPNRNSSPNPDCVIHGDGPAGSFDVSLIRSLGQLVVEPERSDCARFSSGLFFPF